MNIDTALDHAHTLNFQHRTCALAPALLLMLAVGVTALAGTPSAAAAEQPTTTVTFHRAELANDEGVAAVHDRIRRAAMKVCHDFGVRDLSSKRSSRECRERVMADALAAIDSERLNRLHASRTGARPKTADDV